MSEYEYVDKAFDAGLIYDNEVCKWYVDPKWELSMPKNGKPDNMWEIMKAEVVRRNLKKDKVNKVCEEISNVLDEIILPTIKDEQNKTIETMLS